MKAILRRAFPAWTLPPARSDKDSPSAPDSRSLYSPQTKFPVPGFHVLRQSEKDAALIVAAGFTVHEALKAAEQLKSSGILVRVVDMYCIKPISGAQLSRHLLACNNFLITVEDHYPEGGLGDAVISALAEAGAAPARFRKLAVNGLPHSGKSQELIDAFGISSRHICDAVRN